MNILIRGLIGLVIVLLVWIWKLYILLDKQRTKDSRSDLLSASKYARLMNINTELIDLNKGSIDLNKKLYQKLKELE